MRLSNVMLEAPAFQTFNVYVSEPEGTSGHVPPEVSTTIGTLSVSAIEAATDPALLMNASVALPPVTVNTPH
jgi:hypothetical protein